MARPDETEVEEYRMGPDGPGADTEPARTGRVIDLRAEDSGVLFDDLPLGGMRFHLGEPVGVDRRRRSQVVQLPYVTVAVSALLVAAAVQFGRSDLGVSHRSAAVAALVLVLLAVCSFSGGRLHAAVVETRETPGDREFGEELDAESADLIMQARLNEQQLRTYRDLAVTQARSTFWQCQLAMLLALLILCAGGAAVMIWPDRAQTQITVLTALGSSFAAFIAKTFIDARNRSIEQLNRSYVLPLAKNLLLFARKLAKEANELTVQDELLRSIVATTLRTVEGTQAGSAARGTTATDVTRSLRRRKAALSARRGRRADG